MARDLLWEGKKSTNLDDFVLVSQTYAVDISFSFQIALKPFTSLVDLFSTPDATPNISHVRRCLVEYYSLLSASHLTNGALSDLPLPRKLDPRSTVPLGSRLLMLAVLLRDSLAVLVRLPFFLFPLLVHAPAYAVSKWAEGLAEDEEETRAQMKIVTGLLLLFMIYSSAFFFVWALLWYTPIGALFAAATVWLLAVYHTRLIDGKVSGTTIATIC